MDSVQGATTSYAKPKITPEPMVTGGSGTLILSGDCGRAVMLLGEEFCMIPGAPTRTSASIPCLGARARVRPQLDSLGPRGAVGRLIQDLSTTTSLIWITGVKSV